MTTLDTTSIESLQKLQRQLVARLSHVRCKVRTRLVIQGAAIFLAEMLGVAILTFLLDKYLRLGTPARLGLLAAWTGGLLIEAWRRIVEPLRLRLGLVALAGAIDHNAQRGGDTVSHLAARVASVLELPGLLEKRDPPSPVMVDRAVKRCHESIAALDFEAHLDPTGLKKAGGIIALALLAPLLLSSVFPRPVGLWARRLFLASSEPWPQRTYLELADVRDGRLLVPRGEPYVLRVQARAGSLPPERVRLTIRGTDKTTVLMKEFAKNDFRHDFAVVDVPLQIEIAGGDDDLGPITLEPVDRPRVTSLELVAQHPRDAVPQSHHFSGGDADLSFLVKTRLALTVAANVPLKEVRLNPGAARPAPADLQRIDATHYAVEWVHEAAARFDLELVAADSGLVSLPVPVSVGFKVDQPPRVTMAYSGVRARITPQARIPLTIEARDDFGIFSAGLAIKDETPAPDDPARLVPRTSAVGLFPTTAPAATQPAALEKEIQLKPEIDVAAMKLPAGALLSIEADATDDCYTGRQVGRSRSVTFRLVPREELFREILLRQQAERVKFRKQSEEAEKLRDAIQALADPRQAVEVARRHRAGQREILRIATALTESLTEIKLNALGSPESHAMMEQTVLKPLKSLADDLLSLQTTALDALAPAAGEAPDAAKIQAAALRQEQIVAQMKTILKQMAQWDSFVDVLNQLDEIIKLETQVKDQSEKLQKKETEGLFDK